MSRTVDRAAGIALAVLGVAVFWSSRGFPVVPGQKLGAGFLPGIVGVGLILCAVALVLRSLRAPAPPPGEPMASSGEVATSSSAETDAGELPRRAAPLLVVASIVAFVTLATPVGFLLVAPPCLVVLLLALGRRWGESLLWALGATVVVHLVFYKLLRVPLPWGVLPPLY
jgi:putative tricarboxylic transport membrane protein